MQAEGVGLTMLGLSGAVVVLTALLTGTSALAATLTRTPESQVGASVRPISDSGRTYWQADIPVVERMHDPLLQDLATLTSNVRLTWGIAGGFSFCAVYGIGVRWYPTSYASVFQQADFGTFFLTNYTVGFSAGVDFSIPLERGEKPACLVLGPEYFFRDTGRLIGFIKKPQWYVSGSGLGFRVGIALPRRTERE